MSLNVRSNYYFEHIGQQRIFQHQRIIDNAIYECTSCRSACPINAPYSEHWRNETTTSLIKVGTEERQLMDTIERRRVESYILCDESAANRTREFLLEAGTEALPKFLHFMFFGAQALEISIGFYVNVPRTAQQKQQLLFFESSNLCVRHHFDVNESVDVIFTLLLMKIRNYLVAQRCGSFDDCSVKRLKVSVLRVCTGVELQLPLICRRQNVSQQAITKLDFFNIKQAYLKNAKLPDELQVDLYCFRVCPNTKEHYLVPYHMQTFAKRKSTKKLCIMNNVTGEFQAIHELPSDYFKELKKMDPGYSCCTCTARFEQRTEYILHCQLKCGKEFTVLNIDLDYTEIYENCLKLPYGYFGFNWYGIANL